MPFKNGLIIKAISGFYYVNSNNIIYECKPRGVFRNTNHTPLVGDYIEFEINDNDSDNNKGTIINVNKRKNEFLRPPMANIDQLFIVVSTVSPNPSYLVLDKLIAVCEYKNITPIIIITKIDIKQNKELLEIYKNSGFNTISISNIEDDDFSEIHSLLNGKISAFAGNTGVGKSSLINNLIPNLNVETSSISEKLGRGRHTTRHVELFQTVGKTGFIADTPGFGTMEINRYDIILKEQLQYCFREFKPYINNCKFTGCSHTCEKDCAVLKALEQQKIQQSRFESYKEMYNQAKEIKEWELKKGGKFDKTN